MSDETPEPVSVRRLAAGDVFQRHGRTWTVQHIVRGWYGSVHVMCVGGGDVWFPQSAEVVVIDRSGS
jgi:hypothetical protein